MTIDRIALNDRKISIQEVRTALKGIQEALTETNTPNFFLSPYECGLLHKIVNIANDVHKEHLNTPERWKQYVLSCIKDYHKYGGVLPYMHNQKRRSFKFN